MTDWTDAEDKLAHELNFRGFEMTTTHTNPLDDIAAALHKVFQDQPACYVWELADRAEIVLDRTDVNPHFAHQLIPLYTREQLERALGETE